MVKASIIITSYNNLHNLEECLKSLINQNYDRNLIDLEMIIVDSGSTDNSIEILDKYKEKIKVILKPSHLPRLSPAIARNIGVQNSKGDILIFSDSDCIFPSDWVKDMIASFKNPQIDCVIGSREPDVGQGLGTFIRRYDFILYSNKFSIQKAIIINKRGLQEDTPFVLMAGNNFAIKKEVWNKLGGMRTVFKHPAGEDIMLEIELIKSSYNFLFNPRSKVIHIHPVSLIKVFQKAFQNGEATYFLSKYSNNFVNWRHFAQRGHIFNLKSLLLNILLIVSLLLIVALLKLPLLIKLIGLFVLFLIILTNRLIGLRNKLDLILNSKGEEYKRIYKTSLFQLFHFNIIHFLLKSTALISFLWTFLIRK